MSAGRPTQYDGERARHPCSVYKYLYKLRRRKIHIIILRMHTLPLEGAWYAAGRETNSQLPCYLVKDDAALTAADSL